MLKRHNQDCIAPVTWTATCSCCAMIIVVGNGHSGSSSNLDEAVCILHCANTFDKGIYPIILSLAMSKQ